jgi:hypothetical protein
LICNLFGDILRDDDETYRLYSDNYYIIKCSLVGVDYKMECEILADLRSLNIKRKISSILRFYKRYSDHLNRAMDRRNIVARNSAAGIPLNNFCREFLNPIQWAENEVKYKDRTIKDIKILATILFGKTLEEVVFG